MPKGLPISYIKKWGISKLAWKKFRAGALTKGVPTRTASIKKRLKGEKRMAKRRYGRRRRGSMTIPLAPIVGIIAMPAISNAINAGMKGDWVGSAGVVNQLKTMVGIWGDGSFHIETLISNIVPPLAGLAVHYIAGRAGINRALGRAKVPLIRI